MSEENPGENLSLPEDGTFRLDGRQFALHRALAEQDPRLAIYYEGALVALANTANPDRLAHACHGIRELMEKLARYLEVPIEASNVTLTSKVGNLRQDWERMKKNTGTISSDGWQGAIDDPLKRFMNRAQEFFDWQMEHRPSRTAAAKQVLRILDPLDLPDRLVALGAVQYQDMRDFFEGVSHHRESSEEEIAGWLASLERFLLERLVPRTSDDFRAIDQVIGGSSANS